VTVARTGPLDRLAYQIVFPYLSVYIVASRERDPARPVNSLGLVAAGLVSLHRLAHRTATVRARSYPAGIGLLAFVLAYAVAQSLGHAIGRWSLTGSATRSAPQLRHHLRQLPW